jgi:putative membrane protein
LNDQLQEPDMISTTRPDFSRYLVTLPDFALYFICALILLMLFLVVYTRLTPQHEWKLIKEGNAAAAISLSGATIGFAIPLSSAIMNSQSLVDALVWGIVALIVQWGAFAAARILVPRLPDRITRGETAAGIVAGGLSIAIGLLNAACMTY